MKSFKYNFLLFLIGAVGYSIIEILWKGSTHWTMAVDGGICLICIAAADTFLSEKSIFVKAFVSSCIITTVELISGIILNLYLNMAIWDYSDKFMNLYGQICPLYSFLWYLLSLAVLFVMHKIKNQKVTA